MTMPDRNAQRDELPNRRHQHPSEPSRGPLRRPPAAAEKLLRQVLPVGLVGETILGDLHQELEERARQRRPFLSLWYWWHALELAARYAARSTEAHTTESH